MSDQTNASNLNNQVLLSLASPAPETAVNNPDVLSEVSSVDGNSEKPKTRGRRAVTYDAYAEPLPDDFREEPTLFFRDKQRFFHADLEEDDRYVYQKEGKFKRIVFLDFKVKHIDSINTSEERFRGHFHFYFTWLATHSEFQSWLEWEEATKRGEDRGEWVPAWMPLIRWTNRVDGSHDFVREHGKNPIRIKPGKKLGFNTTSENEVTPDLLGFDHLRGQWLRCQFEADMHFAEEFELQNFPVDCQDLGIHAQSFDSTSQIDFLPLPRGVFCRVDPEDSVMDEWDLENLVVEFRHSSPATSRKGRLYAEMHIQLKVARRWTAFIGHLFATTLMCALALVAFAIRDALGERLSYCITLLLADVALQQVVFMMLPNIPYETLMDRYLYFCFTYISVITAYSGFTRFEWVADHDTIFGYSFAGVFAIALIYFWSTMKRSQKSERMKLYLPTSALERYMSARKWFRSQPKLELVWTKEQDARLHSDANGDIIFSPSVVQKNDDFPTKEQFEEGFRSGTGEVKILSDLGEMVHLRKSSLSSNEESEDEQVVRYLTSVYSALGDETFISETIYGKDRMSLNE